MSRRADPPLTGPTTELLQALIRGACVNDGTPGSGEEHRNASVIDDALDGLPGVGRTVFEPLPGRRSVVHTLPGSDPDAPTILLLGHTDVVPVNAAEWRHDPFGGELIDGEVWGRGAVDMLNLTSAMATSFAHLATRGRPPASTVRFLAVADEEAGGTWGANWICANAWDEVACDYVLTESGGMTLDAPDGMRVVFAAAEKGVAWRRLTVHGTPGHGSMPFGADNALVTAAEVVRRIDAYDPAPQLHSFWTGWVAGLDVPDALREALLDPGRVREAIGALDAGQAGYAHAVVHTTFSPNMVRGGIKTNVIPDTVELDIDIRTLPGVEEADVDRMVADALGDLADRVTVTPVIDGRTATRSPIETPMFDLLARRAAAVHDGAEVLPWMVVGGTDAAFFRMRGVPSYGAGMYDPSMSLAQFQRRFHGHDERIDTTSLGLSAQLYVDLADGIADATRS
ncbi:MAG: M20/M25/M40 family metallo-hydrolase [Nitriliruptoraceae bacterium]|nr:M20/M25/M40 family metallo-hydrolase [Nitriliruptoraceae bacterium]